MNTVVRKTTARLTSPRISRALARVTAAAFRWGFPARSGRLRFGPGNSAAPAWRGWWP
jgi:hypothetical protein